MSRITFTRSICPRACLWVGVVLIALFTSGVAYAQPGSLSGRVLDGEVGEPLPLASVVIETLDTGTATNVDGQYRITGLPAGTYAVTYSFTGFTSKTVTDVSIQAGEVTTLNVSLYPATEALDEVVVTAQRERGSTADVLNERKVAASVIDVLDVEQIAAAGGSAAAAIERVSGAEVTEGKYVQVRGFGGRYGKVTINGVPVPSIAPDEKSVPLDVVSSDVLQSATVTKGWTPDQPADFVGGLVDLRTLDTPGSLQLDYKAKVTYNTATSFKDGLMIGGCDDMWTGFSDCYRWPESVARLPDSVGVTGEIVHSGPREGAHYAAVLTDEAAVAAVASDIANMMPVGPSAQRLPLSQSYELSGGNRFTLAGRPVGILAVGSYDNGFQQFADYQFNAPNLDPVFGDVLQTEHTVRVAGLAGLNYAVNDANQVRGTLIYNRLTEDLALYQAGLYDPNGEQQTARTLTTQRVASSLLSGQLSGKHALFKQVTAAWTGAYSRTRRLEPGTMTMQYQGPQGLGLEGNITDFDIPDSLVLTAGVNRKGTRPRRYHFDQHDDAYLGKLDLAVPFRLDGRRISLKAGAFADLSTRKQDGHRVIFFANGDFSELSPKYVFAPENMVGAFVAAGSSPTAPGVYIDEETQEADNFTASLDVRAGYIMLDAEPVRGLRLLGGVRLTDSQQRVELIPKRNGAAARERDLPFGQSYTIERRFTDWLPALSLQYAITEEMDIRAGYGRTIGRPQFRELVPFQYQPRPGAPSIGGNPELERTLIDNTDLRLSWYPVPTALFSIGVFYKHFDGPVEPQVGSGSAFINTGKANTYGGEGEVRMPFGFIMPGLSAWAARLNLTVLRTKAGAHSFVQIPDDPGTPLQAQFIPAGNRPLFGQTPVLFNAGLTYDSARRGTSATVLLRYTGEQLRYLSSNGLRTFREPVTTLDVVLGQQLWQGFRLGVELRNLVGSEIRYLTERPGNQQVIADGVVRVIQRVDESLTSTQEFYDRGRSLEVSLSWSLN